MTIGGCEKRDCPAFDKCTAQYRGSRCAALRYSYGLDDPKTNYDSLIRKTPEEMAKWLGDKDTCPPERWKHLYDDVDCAECWLAWMKQEATDAK